MKEHFETLPLYEKITKLCTKRLHIHTLVHYSNAFTWLTILHV